MSLKHGKREVQQIIDILDQDHSDVETAARACLAAMEELFEKRAQFVVVGQRIASKERLTIPTSDPEAVKVSLGWYSTEGDARAASESLWHNTASGDTFQTWVLPVYHGTPANFHGKLKQQYVDKQAKLAANQQERFKKAIQAVEERNAAKIAEIRAMEQAAGQDWPCPSSRIKTGTCKHDPQCK